MTTTHSSWWKVRRLGYVLIVLLLIGVASWLWFHRSPASQISQLSQSKPIEAIQLIAPSPSVPIVSPSPTKPPSVPTQMSAPSPRPLPTPVIVVVTPASAPAPTVARPTPTPSVTSVPQPVITNGNFNQGLTGWLTHGEVKALPLAAGDSPPQTSESFSARLASANNLDWLGSHQLTQTIALNSETSTIQFWYRVWTEETHLGFDDPALVLTLDEQVVWRVGAAVAWPSASNAPLDVVSSGQPRHSEWQLVSLPLAQFTKLNQPHTLQFSAGQTGDQKLATWVDITGIALVPSVPRPQLVTTEWGPESISLEWPIFTHLAPDITTTYLIGALDTVDQVPTWIDLFHRLQAPVGWQSHTITTLASAQTNSWQPMSWNLKSGQAQPDFTFPFSVNHEGFTGTLLAGLAPYSSLPPQLPTPAGQNWMGWDMVSDALNRPQSLIWLSSSRE